MGLELRVKTDTDAAYVEEIARFVEERVRKASADGASPTVGSALLAAMNIADELHKARRGGDAAEAARNRRIQGLLERVESALDA